MPSETTPAKIVTNFNYYMDSLATIIEIVRNKNTVLM